MFRSILTAAFASSLFLAASSASAFTANAACETSTDSTNKTDVSPSFTVPNYSTAAQNVVASTTNEYAGATECPDYFVVQYDNVAGKSFQAAGGLASSSELPTNATSCDSLYINEQVFGYEAGAWKVIGTSNEVGQWDAELSTCLIGILPGTTAVVPYISDSPYSAVRVAVQAYQVNPADVGPGIHIFFPPTFVQVATSLTPAFQFAISGL